MRNAILGSWLALCCVFAAQAVNGAEPGPDAVATAFAAVQADVSKLVEAKAAVAALAKAQADLVAAQANLAKSRAALLAAIDAAASDTPIVPPVAKTVSLLVVSNTATCPPCRVLAPILDKLIDEGIPIVVLQDDLATTQKWSVKVTPTIIMLVDSAEVSRSAGSQPEKALRYWYQKTLVWSKK